MRKRERFLRQSRMALCAAGLIGFGVTSANADLAFKFDILDLKLNAGDTATSVAGQGFDQVLLAPDMVVGLQLNGTVLASPPGVGAPIGEQRALWSTNGSFQTTASGAKVDLTGNGASLLFTANIAPGGVAGTYTVPAIAPFVSSGTTVGAATDVGGDGDLDLTNVWMRQAPVTATDLGSGNWTYNTPTPNVQDGTSATWYVAKVNATAQAALGAGNTTVSYQPSASEDGVLFVDNGGVKTGTTGVVTSAGVDLLAGPAITVTGKAVAKLGASGYAADSLTISDGDSLTLLGGGPLTTGALAVGAGSVLEIGSSRVSVVGGNEAAIDALVAGNQITSSALAAGLAIGVAPIGGSVVAQVTVLGDADLSGIVDVSDFNTWFANLGDTAGRWSIADFDRSGIVDVGDFNIWFSNLGASIPLGSIGGLPEAAQAILIEAGAVAVPEPAAFSLMAIAAMGLMARRRTR